MGDQRRQKILIGVLVVVALLALARFTVFSDGGDDNSTTPTSGPRSTANLGPSSTSTTVDPNAIPSPTGEIDIYDGPNPFEPAIFIAPSTSSTTTSSTVPGASTSSTSSTTPGATTTSTIPTNNPSPNTFTLLTITRQTNGTYVATVQIGTQTYSNVLESNTFGPGNTYRFVRGLDDNCGRFQHGDVTFDLCEGSSTLK